MSKECDHVLHQKLHKDGRPTLMGPVLQDEWLVCPHYKPIRKSPLWSINSWGLGAELSKTEELRGQEGEPRKIKG